MKQQKMIQETVKQIFETHTHIDSASCRNHMRVILRLEQNDDYQISECCDQTLFSLCNHD